MALCRLGRWNRCFIMVANVIDNANGGFQLMLLGSLNVMRYKERY